jgi:transposase InsO family protein
MKYRFVEVHAQQWPVQRMCALLGISRSGYYAWKKRPPSQRTKRNEELLQQIRKIYKDNRKVYGSPRVHAALKKQGVCVSKKTVARLMQEDGLVGVRKNRKVRTTDSNHSLPVASNLLDRDFSADQPNQKWVADITYIPTGEGWLYLASVLDLFSRKIVGWSMSSQIDADLVAQALRMAFYLRRPGAGLLHHSDRGSQYASHQIHDLLAANQIQISMSRRANCYDNAAMESFFGTLKNEWVHHQKYTTRAQARTDIFSYIEGFYNTVRLHSTLGYCSPNEFEANYHQSP